MPAPHPRAPAAAACRVGFAAAPEGTRLARASAGAPWRVVRARAAPRCEVVLVQTRGGLIDGDRWRLEVEAEPGTRAALRSVGATVIHPGDCFVRARLHAGAGARLGQRSAGLILRPGARLRSTTVIRADRDGVAAAMEVVGLAGLSGGVLRLVALHGEDVLLDERTRLDGDRSRSWRMGRFTHIGTVVAVGDPSRLREGRWRSRLPASAGMANPRPGCLLIRALGRSIEELDLFLGPLTEEITQ